MEVLRRYEFPVVKGTKAGELFDLVLAAVGQQAAKRARIVAEDGHGKISAIDRAIKRFSELEPYRLRKVKLAGRNTNQMLSNIDAHHGEGVSCSFVSTDTLRALVRGVPRSYPFFKAEILFLTALPWQERSINEPPLPCLDNWNVYGEPISHFSFHVDWRSNGYRAFVEAAISLGDAKTFGNKLPDLPEVASKAIDLFGKPRTQLMLGYTENEQAKLDQTKAVLRTLHKEWRDRSTREMARLDLPHALSAKNSRSQFNPLTRPHKAVLVSIFKPRGYRYATRDSGHGYFTLYKQSARGNRIEISFDVGSTSRRYSGGMSVVGMHGTCYARLPAHPKQPHRFYEIASDQVWQQVVENVAVLVDHLEEVFVPAVDEILGQAPDWYEW